MAVRTSSSSVGNGRAWASVLVAILGLVAIPAGVYVARQARNVNLIDAAYAIPLGAALGLLAIGLSVGARRRFEWTLGRAGGMGVARLGRVLGVLAVCVAVASGIAIGFFYLLRNAG